MENNVKMKIFYYGIAHQSIWENKYFDNYFPEISQSGLTYTFPAIFCPAEYPTALSKIIKWSQKLLVFWEVLQSGH